MTRSGSSLISASAFWLFEKDSPDGRQEHSRHESDEPASRISEAQSHFATIHNLFGCDRNHPADRIHSDFQINESNGLALIPPRRVLNAWGMA